MAEVHLISVDPATLAIGDDRRAYAIYEREIRRPGYILTEVPAGSAPPRLAALAPSGVVRVPIIRLTAKVESKEVSLVHPLDILWRVLAIHPDLAGHDLYLFFNHEVAQDQLYVYVGFYFEDMR